MTNLRAVSIGQNKFCGPAVLSILTGRNTDDCAYAITRVNGKYDIKGVTTVDLLKAAESLGFVSEEAPTGNTLYGTFIRLANTDGIYIVSIKNPNHFVIIEVKDKKIYFCDNHTKEPIPAESSSRMHQGVERADRVWEKPVPPPPPTPILLRTSIKVTNSLNSCFIERYYEHVNPDDNRYVPIGSIKAKDTEEFVNIIRRLSEDINP